jgi:hypothetical protein
MVVKRRLDVCRALLACTVLVVLLSRAVPANTVGVNSSSQGTKFDEYTSIQFVPALSAVAGPTSNHGAITGAMVFDLSFIPRGTTITSASFTMSVGGTSVLHGNPVLGVSDYVGSSPTVSLGDFSLVTNPVGFFNNLPPNAPVGSINIVQTFDVSGFIQSLVNNGTPYAGFQFADQLGAEFIPGSTVPTLTITSPVFLAVPEPRSALLLALGMATVLLGSVVARPLGITKRSAGGRTRR